MSLTLTPQEVKKLSAVNPDRLRERTYDEKTNKWYLPITFIYCSNGQLLWKKEGIHADLYMDDDDNFKPEVVQAIFANAPEARQTAEREPGNFRAWVDKVALSGRVIWGVNGSTQGDDNKWTGKKFNIVAFWASEVTKLILPCLKKLKEELKVDDDFVVISVGSQPTTVGSLLKTGEYKDNPCAKLCKFTGDGGQQYNYADIAGAPHMRRGIEFERRKNAVCSQGPGLLDLLRKYDCDPTLVTDLLSSYNCAEDKLTRWQKALSGGRQLLKRDLDPKNITKNFRTQKEIDDAWGDCHRSGDCQGLGFKEWLSWYEAKPY